MQHITIYHNPNCGTSRNTLAFIKHQGIEPTVIHYLENPPTEPTLRDLIAKMGICCFSLFYMLATLNNLGF